MKGNSFSRTLLVTTMSAAGYERYGRRMLATMKEKLSPFITLRLYTEGFVPSEQVFAPQWEMADLATSAPWLAEFKAWCDADPIRCGRLPGGGYDFNRDARRFSHKIAAFTAAALGDDARAYDVMGWCDADLVAHEPIDAEWISNLLPTSRYLAWLDRDAMYPELGFFLVRPGHQEHREIWQEVQVIYTSKAIISYERWHDCEIIQRVVERAVRDGVIPPPVSLSGERGRRTGHPLINSLLGARLDHLKGPRKDAGRSHARDLRVPRQEPYWRG